MHGCSLAASDRVDESSTSLRAFSSSKSCVPSWSPTSCCTVSQASATGHRRSGETPRFRERVDEDPPGVECAHPRHAAFKGLLLATTDPHGCINRARKSFHPGQRARPWPNGGSRVMPPRRVRTLPRAGFPRSSFAGTVSCDSLKRGIPSDSFGESYGDSGDRWGSNCFRIP